MPSWPLIAIIGLSIVRWWLWASPLPLGARDLSKLFEMWKNAFNQQIQQV
jgi:hypothetical protein